MEWFRHDSDANQDAKLQNVLLDYGLEGYGLYWYCVELIVGKVSKDNLTFEIEHDARLIARNTGSTTQKVEEMMRYFVKLGLFESSDNVITCLKIAKRLNKSMTSNPKMRELIGRLNHDGVMMGHDGVMTNTDGVMQEENRIEENIYNKELADKSVNESKKKKINFASWPSEPDKELIKEWRKIRSTKKHVWSQSVVDRAGKEMHLALERGYSVNDALLEFTSNSWSNFKAEWLKVKRMDTSVVQDGDGITADMIKQIEEDALNAFAKSSI